MQVFIKILKIILGVALGLSLGFLTIVCLDAILPNPNPFGGPEANLWWFGVIISIWTFFFLWLMMRWKTPVKKMHTQGIEDLPLSISELIDEIIDAMKYRRSVRAEVRQELADHFTDALADCQDEQAKQECVKKLIEEFGDVQLLGTLLRRAKKRCRPLWRTMVARTFQFIGICFLLLVVYLVWFFTGKPAITTDYLAVLNQQVRPVADESQNAWPFYKQAAEKRVKYENEDKDKKFDFSPRNPKTLSEEDRRIILQAVSDNQESFDLIRQGNEKPSYWQTYGSGENESKEMIAMLLPNLGDYRRLTYLMYWQARLDAEQGKLNKAFTDALETYSFGQHLRGQNTMLIEQLVAIAIEAMSTNTMRMVLSECDGKIDAPLLDSARKRFEGMINKEDFTIDFEGEKLLMYDEAQRCFTESRFGRSHLYWPRLNEMRVFDGHIDLLRMNPLRFLFTHPDKEETLRGINQYYSKIDEMAALTPASVKFRGLDSEKTVKELIQNNIFLMILAPALEKINQIAWRNRTETCATLAILAVLQYQKQHGVWPETLDTLVEKGLLKEVPMDPYSNQPLVYKKTDGGFMLYSVGTNFTDDGGVSGTKNGKPNIWSDNGDTVFWPVDE